MKAIVCKRWGPPSELQLEEVPAPHPKEGEVLVQVVACGLNFPDTLIIQGLYQFKPPLPFSPGSDVAGVVKALGPGVTHLKEGDEVFGFVAWGGLAQEVVVPARQCFSKPAGMDFTMAASFMMAYGTSYHALKDRARLQAGESLLVLGAAGGVGLAAVELGHLMGTKVLAAASTEEKLALCRQHGADETINYSHEDFKSRLKDLTAGKGVDVVYDPVGGAYAEPALRSMAWEGRYLVVGFAAGEIPRIPLNLPLLKGCAIMGVFWGGFATRFPAKNLQNAKELLGWQASGQLKPYIDKVYALEQAPQALEDLMNRKAKGKLVVGV